MTPKNDLQKIELFLQQIKPAVVIPEAHKRALRQRLLSDTPQPHRPMLQYALAGGLAVFLALMFLLQPGNRYAVGMIQADGSPMDKVHIYNQTPTQVEKDSTILLADSSIQVQANTRISITTDHQLREENSLPWFDEQKQGSTQVNLDLGAVKIAVRKRSQEQTYWVNTPDVKVQVTGTVFTVAVEPKTK